MLTRMVPTKIHAGLDYAVGLLLIASPWIFGFVDESTAATWIAVLAGVAMLGMSAITDYEGGLLARTIPMPTHLLGDGALGVILAASPWLFGFADRGTNAWLPFLVIGLGEISAALTTERQPRDSLGRRHAHA